MKKLFSILSYLLFVFLLILPIGKVLAYCFGYCFEPVSYLLFAVILLVLSVAVTVVSVIAKDVETSVSLKVLFGLLPVLSMVSTVFYIISSMNYWVALCMLVCIGCSCYLAVRRCDIFGLKLITLILEGLLIIPLILFCGASLLFGNIGELTVVKTVESPDAAYYAQVIDDDQGALGGNTVVDVYKDAKLDLLLLLFKVYPKPQTVYVGEWGEFENIEIYWEDNKSLVINSKEYEIE